nr:hypothetical protein [Tanacetum cinerariifolium]
MFNIFNVSSEDFLEDLFLHKISGNPTFSLHKEITSPKVTHEIHDSEGCNFLSEELPDIDSFNDIHPHFDDNPLSGSTTYSSNSLLEEFTDELALITYPLDYDDNLKFDIESDLREIEFLLYQGKDFGLKDSIDQTDLTNLDDYFVDPTPEMFTDEHAPDYSFPLRFDGEKIKESKLLIDELDLPYDFLPYFEYDSYDSQGFSRDDDWPSPNNEDKVFNLGILIQEKSVTIITRVAQEKKLATSYASLVFEDFHLKMRRKFSNQGYTLLRSSSMGEFGPAQRPKTSASWEATHAYHIPGNMKTIANGFCTQVFISSV